MTVLLEAEGLTVRFGGLTALDGLSLRAAAGSIVGLIGPNGAGKSTCFGVLSGLQRPLSGRVLIDGQDVTRASVQARARQGLARTFQRLEMFPDLTVREHLVVAYRGRSGGTARGLLLDCLGLGARPHDGEDDLIEDILARLGLSRLASSPAAVLPLGTGRLVEVARALATRPRLLLLDEPSSGLDARETDALAEVLAALRETDGVALLLVEHNVDMVLRLADRITVLDFGKVIAEGTPAEIRASDAVQAAYLGTSA